jgi:hypothetical protein
MGSMRFYYFSIFSWAMYAVYAVVAIAIVSLLWTKVLDRKLRNPGYWILLTATLIAPFSEELWIAYNFDRLCQKDAGVFVNKTVDVDGFYDDTTHWWRQLRESSNFKFVESRDTATGQVWRVERDGDGVRHVKIDKPTARYHYRSINSHTPVGHQISRFENVVLDSSNGEVLGRYTNYYRGPYWFFIQLSAPTIPCKETESAVRTYGTVSVYALTFKPSK